ncbi:hypothetical protein GZ78_03705 [Endozoicomonas numazuensis]|uniref:Uncharacterized protein n=1 Tax=Endozoicomonas numazuensis TaxID=1137799 RepID=A0A081NKZ9_9GAMM|nr:hypothetical protein GZ78_03705 [Endozoicomonas numazuensis]
MSQNDRVSHLYTHWISRCYQEAVLSSLIEHHYDLRTDCFDYEACKTSGDYSKIQSIMDKQDFFRDFVINSNLMPFHWMRLNMVFSGPIPPLSEN